MCRTDHQPFDASPAFDQLATVNQSHPGSFVIESILVVAHLVQASLSKLANMCEVKSFNKVNVHLPFPYPLLDADRSPVWPFREEGFVLIDACLDRTDNLVAVSDTAAIFTLLKMGFFGFNSNKEINHFCLIESLNSEDRAHKSSPQNFTLGFYSMNTIDIPQALSTFPTDSNKSEQPQFQHQLAGKSETSLSSLKLTLEESYFLSYVFGLLAISNEAGQHYSLKELWACFCAAHREKEAVHFAAKYAAYHYLRSNGWIVRNGLKFGSDYLLYKEGPPFYHACYSVIVTSRIEQESHSNLKWNEVSLLTRVTKNARKKLLICTVTIPKAISQDLELSPECIQHFTVDLLHVNRWNSTKGEFDSAKVFHNL